MSFLIVTSILVALQHYEDFLQNDNTPSQYLWFCDQIVYQICTRKSHHLVAAASARAQPRRIIGSPLIPIVTSVVHHPKLLPECEFRVFWSSNFLFFLNRQNIDANYHSLQSLNNFKKLLLNVYHLLKFIPFFFQYFFSYVLLLYIIHNNSYFYSFIIQQ